MFHTNKKLPFARIGKIAAVCAGCYAFMAQADTTLVYETLDKDGAKTQHTFSISGRFVRIDAEPSKQPGYALFDSGRMVMFFVDDKTKSYTPVRATPPIMESMPHVTQKTEKPTDPAPGTTLKATKKKRTVADKRCRVVMEMVDDKQVAEHCMSGTGELGLSTREMMTLSRLFTKTGDLDLGLPGTATTDESYASIQTQRQDDKASQKLISSSKQAIPAEKLRIPREYKQLEPVATKEQ